MKIETKYDIGDRVKYEWEKRIVIGKVLEVCFDDNGLYYKIKWKKAFLVDHIEEKDILGKVSGKGDM